MRKCLIVGVDYYEHINQLYGCVNDAYSVKTVLDRHSDWTKNFDVHMLTGTWEGNIIERRDLKDSVNKLFSDANEIALFYFSWHGHLESTWGYLVTSECEGGDEGLSMNELLEIANQSPAKNKIIILDCCHSGIAWKTSQNEVKSILSEWMTILTASSETQYAIEENGSGIFTSLFVDAMNWGASNLVGDITPWSIYAHIDQSLGAWDQRPIFKTNVTAFTTLRKVQPPITLSELKMLTELFPIKWQEYKLDPSYEPDSDSPIEENVSKFRILQKYNRVNLVVPVGAEHMYYAAIESKSCKLTILGEHYWNLITKERI